MKDKCECEYDYELSSFQPFYKCQSCSKVDYVKSLEAKNVELEKHNEMLAHQLKYARKILTDVQADKFKLRGNLETAVEALKRISEIGYYYDYGIHRDISMEALAAINDT